MRFEKKEELRSLDTESEGKMGNFSGQGSLIQMLTCSRVRSESVFQAFSWLGTLQVFVVMRDVCVSSSAR